MTLNGTKDIITRRRRRKPKKEDGEKNDIKDEESSDTETEESPPNTIESKITDDDGIFTLTIGSTSTSTSAIDKKENVYKNVFVPRPRISSGLVVKHNTLYLYGGMFEDGDRQYILSDFYSLGLYIMLYTHITEIYKITFS